MFAFLSNYFAKKGIDCYAPIPLSSCKIVRPYLLERHGIGTSGTVIMVAVPYYTKACDHPNRNLSAYAVSRDYHGFYKELFDELIPALKSAFPTYRFAGFADHSPIEETVAAAQAGLGVIGKNYLILTEKYSSYVFLGEIITDAELDCQAKESVFCENCGACKKACPMEACGGCLSALTQKKGEFSEAEKTSVLKYQSVWGCDICQEVCPYTVRAKRRGTIYSPIPYFEKETIPHLTLDILASMNELDFSKRAFSWRGINTIKRNLELFEASKKGDFEC